MAVEADLIAVGLRWRDIGTGRTNWADIRAVLMTLPRTSATARAIHGVDVEWGLTEHLLASVVDVAQIANWQRSGGKGRRPKPIPRPGVGPKVEHVEMDSFDSPAAFDEWWAANTQGPTVAARTTGTTVARYDPSLARLNAR